MTATEFFLKYNGKFLDFDGINQSQCVDLVKAYFWEVLKLPPIQGNGKDYWKDIPGFKRIPNTLFAYPKPGDVIVWGATPTNPYGHVAVCNWSWLLPSLGVFEQIGKTEFNPTGTPCRYKEYTYKGILGWLRPLNPPTEAPRPTPVDNTSKKVFKCAVVSPQYNDPAVVDAAKYVNDKLMEFSGGRLGFELLAWSTQEIKDPTPETNFITDEAVPILDEKNLSIPDETDYVLVRYLGQSIWTYTVLYDKVWPVPFTIMPSNWPDIKGTLLFEVGHGIIECYNQRRGSLTSISNDDNYSGGEQYVKRKVELVLPYLYLYDLPIT